jgi:hypothetical protein
MPILKRLLPILAAALYVVSPVDALPDFLPGLGWVDDLVVVGAVLWYFLVQQRGRSLQDILGGRSRGAARPDGGGPGPEEFAADFDRMDPYALLEISPQASPAEIRAAYRRAVGRYHPDKVAHLGKEFQDLAHRKLLAIQKAYDLLQARSR